MKLLEGCEAEYQKRHDAIWPQLTQLLKEAGVSDYSIYWDPATNDLLGVLKLEAAATMDQLPAQPLMQKWWAYMADIMETHPDQSPVSVPLTELFYMP